MEIREGMAKSAHATRVLEMRRYPSLETRGGCKRDRRRQHQAAALIRGICSCIYRRFSRSLAWVMSQHDALATNYSRAAVDRRRGREKMERRKKPRRKSGIPSSPRLLKYRLKRLSLGNLVFTQAKILKLVVQMARGGVEFSRSLSPSSSSSFLDRNR